MEETRIPTVGSTTDQSIGTPIAHVVSGFTRREGRKERRMHEVITALLARSAQVNRGSCLHFNCVVLVVGIENGVLTKALLKE
jgi:hypothetical protein